MCSVDTVLTLGSIILRIKVLTWLTRLLPPVFAALVIWLEPVALSLGRSREATLPFGTLILLAVLLHPRMRYFLVMTLCYAVAMLALRDTWKIGHFHTPFPIQSDLLEPAMLVGLWTVAVLATVAGIGESIQSGMLWVKRCYFAAAALYFFGLGLVNYELHGSWLAVVQIVSGLFALVCFIFADRTMLTEAGEDADEPVNDEVLQQALEAAHRTALQAKEWRDTLTLAREDREPGASNGIQSARGASQ